MSPAAGKQPHMPYLPPIQLCVVEITCAHAHTHPVTGHPALSGCFCTNQWLTQPLGQADSALAAVSDLIMPRARKEATEGAEVARQESIASLKAELAELKVRSSWCHQLTGRCVCV